jgi:hypothetical protein
MLKRKGTQMTKFDIRINETQRALLVKALDVMLTDYSGLTDDQAIESDDLMGMLDALTIIDQEGINDQPLLNDFTA